jgi:hypothetical protein
MAPAEQFEARIRRRAVLKPGCHGRTVGLLDLVVAPGNNCGPARLPVVRRFVVAGEVWDGREPCFVIGEGRVEQALWCCRMLRELVPFAGMWLRVSASEVEGNPSRWRVVTAPAYDGEGYP